MRPATWDAYWPVRTKPLADEGFVSWFCRLAWSNGLDAQSLFDVAKTDGNSKHRDLDRFPDPLSIERLASATGADATGLTQRTLKGWCGTVTESIDETGEIPWLPQAGMRKQSRAFGQQACISCLREQPTPYFRQHWRLACLTMCENHREMLIDRCPACAAPIQPLLLQSATSPISVCWRCGQDYRYASPITVELKPFDEALLDAVDAGWGAIPGLGRVHSIAFFRIIWILYRLVAVGQFAKPLQRRFRNDVAMTRIPRTDTLHKLTPAYRRNAINVVWCLLGDWPHTLLKTCRDLSIGIDVLLRGPATPPFALWDVLNEHLTSTPYKVSRGEIAAAKRFLEKRGIAPTPGTMGMLISSPSRTRTQGAPPFKTRAAHGHGQSWKLEGVSTETRLAVIAAARAEDTKLGHWVEAALIKALEA